MINIKRKLLNKTAILGVVGLGYVGLPLAVEKAKAGFKTIGFDVQESKVEMVNAGKNYIGDVVNEDISENLNLSVIYELVDTLNPNEKKVIFKPELIIRESSEVWVKE